MGISENLFLDKVNSRRLDKLDKVLGKESIFAIGYQGTSEAVDLGLPETRILAVASMVLLPGTALSMEYSYDTDYDIADGGTGENASVIITQLAYEF